MSEEEQVIAEEVSEEVTDDVTEDGEEVLDNIESEDEEVSDESEEETVEEETDETPEEAKEPEKYVLKAYGKEFEVDADQLKDLAEQGLGAQQKFQQTAQEKKQLLEAMNDIRDPNKYVETLKKMNVPQDEIRKAMEDYLIAQMEQENLSDEQKQALELKRENEALKAEKAQEVKEKEARELAAQQDKWREKYDNDFTEALSSEEIPKTAESIAKMAFYMESALKEGVEISAKDAATLVKEDMANYYKDLAEKASPEQLISIFGEKLGTKLKNYDLSKIKTPEDGNKVTTNTPNPKIKGRKKRLSEGDWKKALDEKFGGDPWA